MFKNIFQVQTNSSNKRNELLDFIRGLAMILVLLHHSGIPYSEIILAFHMPLFFIISGYTESITDKAKKTSFKEYTWNKFKRIMIPYFAFEIINYFIWIIVCIIKGTKIPTLSALTSIITCINTESYMGLYGRLWFLPCMFVSCCVFWFIIKFIKSKKLIILTTIVSFIISYMISYFNLGRLPFTIDTMFMALPFFLIGYLLSKNIKDLFKKKNKIIDLIITIISIIILLISCKYGAKMYMFINEYGNYITTILAAISGSLAFAVISKYIYQLVNKVKLIKNYVLWYSYNSLISFPVHLQIKCILLLLELPLINMQNWYLLMIIMFFLNIPIVNFYTINLPYITGNIPKKK